MNISLPNTRDKLGIASEKEERYFSLPQRVLIWRRFRKHRLAVFSSMIVLLLFVTAVFADFIAPFPVTETNSQYTYGPPQGIHLFERDGGLRVAPYVYGYNSEIDVDSFQRSFSEDRDRKIYLRLFARGEPHKILGLIETNLHLFGPVDPDERFYLLGADRLGRDMLSRIIMGTRISMSIGLVGVFLSLTIGLVLGGISGYYGGVIDNLIQRVIDFVTSLPTIPLWLGLATAIPLTWDPLYVYFAITVLLSLIGWTEMARAIRGRFLALRDADYIAAARLDGASELTVIFRYMLPAFTSHIIAAVTLAIPVMILSETSLSFLGLGLRPPIVSWGVLLNEAQSIRVLVTAPWLLNPAIPIILAVLALNFLGDGLRDAADPYG